MSQMGWVIGSIWYDHSFIGSDILGGGNMEYTEKELEDIALANRMNQCGDTVMELTDKSNANNRQTTAIDPTPSEQPPA